MDRQKRISQPPGVPRTTRGCPSYCLNKNAIPQWSYLLIIEPEEVIGGGHFLAYHAALGSLLGGQGLENFRNMSKISDSLFAYLTILSKNRGQVTLDLYSGYKNRDQSYTRFVFVIYLSTLENNLVLHGNLSSNNRGAQDLQTQKRRSLESESLKSFVYDYFFEKDKPQQMDEFSF